MLLYIILVTTFILSIYILLSNKTFNILISFFLLVLSVSIIYIVIGSSFIAIVYLIIYLSASLILILADIMLSKKIASKKYNLELFGFIKKPLALIIAIIFFTLASFSNTQIIYNKFKDTNINFKEADIKTIGISLLTQHIIPFEIISLILLALLIGIIIKLK